MPEYRESSGFKFVFWGISILLLFAFFGQVMWLLLGGFRSFPHLFGMEYDQVWLGGPHDRGVRMLIMAVPTCILFIAWISIVSSIVYRDAKKRGMDPYLWATVAAFIPFFIGIIIYLVVRSNGRAMCAKCHAPIRSEYKVCPHCGHRQQNVCPGCENPISPEWKVCPHCEHRLQAGP